MLSPSDEAALRRLVGPTTFGRGTAYARAGAVRDYAWDPDGGRVSGEVQGGRAEPYRTVVQLTRSASGAATRLRATCTCPVGVNCKHAVALLLAANRPFRQSRPAAVYRARGAAPPPLGWEQRLGQLLTTDTEEEQVGPEVGLQLEMVERRPAPGRPPGSADRGIRVRPVVRSGSGNWVTSVYSWETVEAAFGPHRWDYLPADEAGNERRHLLREFLVLGRLAGSTYPSAAHYDSYVWLESIPSRRLWDLLDQARDLHLPLVGAGRPPVPVVVEPVPATVSVDVTGGEAGLRLDPRLTVDGRRVPVDSVVPIGAPAHGIGWSSADPARPDGSDGLHLARLASPVDGGLWSLLRQGPMQVPRGDEPRFLEDVCPSLRLRVELGSSDGSVRLPPPASPTLVLTVTPEADHRLVLTWTWVRARGARPEVLGAPTPRLRDAAGEDAIVAAVSAALAGMPELEQQTPWGERLAPMAVLDGMATARFASERLPVLAGIPGVRIDHNGPIPDYQEALEAPVVRLDGSSTGDGDWLDLTVEVTVGGERVPYHELFRALAEEQTYLILPSGTYFSLDRQELRALAQLIAEARALADPVSGEARLNRLQVGLWEDLCRLGVVGEQARAWDESVRALTAAAEGDRPVPDGLRATLRPYQQAGFNWLAFLFERRLGGLLADDMGLGKTLQALALICHAKEQGLSTSPYLVVAPTSVVGNWAAESRRFTPGLAVTTVTETERRRGIPLAAVADGADVVVTSYALFRLEYEAYEAVEWAGLFLDEAQLAKNRNSKTYQSVRRLPAPTKVAVTGTPLENNLMELWAMLSITAPGLFPDPQRFEEHYRIPIERNGDTDRLDQLRRLIRPLMLRRTKEQVAPELPEKQEQTLQLDLHPRHRKLYQTYLARERQKVLGLLGDVNGNRFEIFRSLTLLRQASLGVSLVDPEHAAVPSAKLDTLTEMLGEIVADGHRALVFSQFTRFLGEARARVEAAGIRHCYLDGRTRKRAAVIEEFRTGEVPVFLVSLKAGGFGLNLTEADYCFLLDPWWNPAAEAQAVDRTHRIGQTRRVMVYRLVAQDTIEEKVVALKAQKSALFANVVDGGGFESASLSAADIQALVS